MPSGDALAAAAALVLERTIALSRVPAPPLQEAERARIVAGWWTGDGLRDVGIDATGNVRALLRGGDASAPAMIVCAHLDTVFETTVRHGVAREGDRLVGPGVGDDTVAVCALSLLDRLLPSELAAPVWLAATVGEEGLGDLAGIRGLLSAPPAPIGALIALEGNYLGRVTTVGVGSVRWRVSIHGPGGHAWEDAHSPSSVHAAAGVITRLAQLADPTGSAGPKLAVNVGRIEGGTTINSRADHAVFLLDLRSGDQPALARLEEQARGIVMSAPAPLRVEIVPIGSRPAGSVPAGDPLVRAAIEALGQAGLSAVHHAASTDANAAHAAGIPAVTVGITTGDRTHTEAEWIDVAPIATGLGALASTIIRWTENERRACVLP